MKCKDHLKQKNNNSEMDIVKALKLYYQENHPVSETLPDSRVYRIRVLTALLKSGVSQIDCIRELLEENALGLISVFNMRQLCCLCLNRMLEKLKQVFMGGLSQLYLIVTQMCVRQW